MTPKILIVDDDPDVREALHELISALFAEPPRRVEVLAASGGLEAVETARRAACALILMDISMPGIDGIDTFHRIAAEVQPTPATMFITGYGTTGVEDRINGAISTGALGCLTKPISLKTLEELVARHVFGEAEP